MMWSIWWIELLVLLERLGVVVCVESVEIKLSDRRLSVMVGWICEVRWLSMGVFWGWFSVGVNGLVV